MSKYYDPTDSLEVTVSVNITENDARILDLITKKNYILFDDERVYVFSPRNWKKVQKLFKEYNVTYGIG